MEMTGTWDRKSVISELNQGRDLANELKRQIYPSTTSREACEYLLEKILSSYDNSLALLNCMDILQADPTSEVLNPHKNINKKRKRKGTWSEQVRLCNGEGDDDGYNWRKYGQKHILGANHPRSYYRCTHRKTQGCLATKQVQRADEDPSISQVLYRGNHSCVQENESSLSQLNGLFITNDEIPISNSSFDDFTDDFFIDYADFHSYLLDE